MSKHGKAVSEHNYLPLFRESDEPRDNTLLKFLVKGRNRVVEHDGRICIDAFNIGHKRRQ